MAIALRDRRATSACAESPSASGLRSPRGAGRKVAKQQQEAHDALELRAGQTAKQGARVGRQVATQASPHLAPHPAGREGRRPPAAPSTHGATAHLQLAADLSQAPWRTQHRADDDERCCRWAAPAEEADRGRRMAPPAVRTAEAAPQLLRRLAGAAVDDQPRIPRRVEAPAAMAAAAGARLRGELVIDRSEERADSIAVDDVWQTQVLPLTRINRSSPLSPAVQAG